MTLKSVAVERLQLWKNEANATYAEISALTGRLVVEAWIQVNLLGLCPCLSRRRVEMGPAPIEAGPSPSD